MHKDEPRWIVAPKDQGFNVPFLKATPIKALENEVMEYEAVAEKGKGKIQVKSRIRETFEMSKG